MDDLEIMDLSVDELIKSYEQIDDFMDKLEKEVKELEAGIDEKRNKEKN